MVEHVDLAPTLLALADPHATTPRPDLDGRSLLPLFAAETAVAARTGYSETHNVLSQNASPQLRTRGEIYSLIRGDWKLVHYPWEPSLDALYDLARDPRELHNAIASEGDTATALLAELTSRGAIDRVVPEAEDLAPEDALRLRELGYID